MEFKNVFDVANCLKKNRVTGFSIDIVPPVVTVSSYYFGPSDISLFFRLSDNDKIQFRIDACNNYCRAFFKFIEK